MVSIPVMRRYISCVGDIRYYITTIYYHNNREAGTSGTRNMDFKNDSMYIWTSRAWQEIKIKTNSTLCLYPSESEK